MPYWDKWGFGRLPESIRCGHKSATRPLRPRHASEKGKVGMSAQATADLILGVVILMPLTVCLVVVAVTWTLEDLATWSEERAKKGRH